MWYKFEINLKSMSQEQSGDIDARLRSSPEPSRAHYHMLIQLFGHPEQNPRSGVKAVFADESAMRSERLADNHCCIHLCRL